MFRFQDSPIPPRTLQSPYIWQQPPLQWQQQQRYQQKQQDTSITPRTLQSPYLWQQPPQQRQQQRYQQKQQDSSITPRTLQSPYIWQQPLQQHQQQQEQDLTRTAFCVFCQANQETPEYVKSHVLRNSRGDVTCPVLYKYRCQICQATGLRAHTEKYCPQNVSDKPEPRKVRRNTAGVYRTAYY